MMLQQGHSRSSTVLSVGEASSCAVALHSHLSGATEEAAFWRDPPVDSIFQ